MKIIISNPYSYFYPKWLTIAHLKSLDQTHSEFLHIFQQRRMSPVRYFSFPFHDQMIVEIVLLPK